MTLHLDDPDTRKREIAGLCEAMQHYGLQEGWILTDDETEEFVLSINEKRSAVPEQKLENSSLNINAAQKLNFFLPSRGRTRSLPLGNPPNDLCSGTAGKKYLVHVLPVWPWLIAR